MCLEQIVSCGTETSIVKCVLNRSCLEQIVSWLAFLVHILRLLHLMLRQLGLVKHREMCLEQIVSCETERSIVKCVLTDCVLNR